MEVFRRYIPKSELQALIAEQAQVAGEGEKVEGGGERSEVGSQMAEGYDVWRDSGRDGKV